jgi:hypothetical protein
MVADEGLVEDNRAIALTAGNTLGEAKFWEELLRLELGKGYS